MPGVFNAILIFQIPLFIFRMVRLLKNIGLDNWLAL